MNIYYKISKWGLIKSLIPNIALLTMFIILIISYSSLAKSLSIPIPIAIIVVGVLIYIICSSSIYSFYLCWLYYRRDKDVIILINHRKNYFKYIQKGKVLLEESIDNIQRIEKNQSYPITPSHSKIFMKDGNCIIVTFLVIEDAFDVFPEVKKKEAFWHGVYIPPSWPNIVKLKEER